VSHLRNYLVVAAMCQVLTGAASFGQTPFYKIVSSAGGPAPANVFAIDVNNDGIADVVQDTEQLLGGFTVSISNGDGTFKAPVTYPILTAKVTPTSLAVGDFNNDGKVDVAAIIPETNQIAVFLGNGDGTFEAPKYSTFTFLPNEAFSTASIVAADYNHDGNIDIVASAKQPGDGPSTVYLLLGDGTGGFSSPADIYNPTSGWIVTTIVEGDFDTDGNADAAVLEEMPCSSGGTTYCSSNVVALFGSGGTTFDAVDVTTVNGTMNLNSGDVNSDGTTDLFGMEDGSEQLAIFQGNYDRKFTYYYWSPYLGTGGTVGPLAMLDSSGDLLGMETDPAQGSTPQKTFSDLFVNGQQGYFQQSTAGTPTSTYSSAPAEGIFNSDVLYDFVVNQNNGPGSTTSTLVTGLNDTAGDYPWYCTFPASGQGIHLCSPATQTTPGPMVYASASSFGMLRKIELWVDGTKVMESHYVVGHHGELSANLIQMDSGSHSATLYAADIDDRLQRYDFFIDIGSTCGPPPQNYLGVNLCAPQGNNGGYPSPVQILATAHISGTLAQMELVLDGNIVYTESTSTTLNTSISPPYQAPSWGDHTVQVNAVNTAGQTWSSPSVFIYVPGSN